MNVIKKVAKIAKAKKLEQYNLKDVIGSLCCAEMDYVNDAFPSIIPKRDVIQRLEHLKSELLVKTARFEKKTKTFGV